MTELFSGSELADLITKVHEGQRLGFVDGVRLFKSDDILAIGYMADIIRRRKNTNKVYFMEDGWENPSESTATMPYAELKTSEERVEYLLKLREWQDESCSFLSFVVSTNQNTGFDDLKALGIARVLLDNIAHIKVSWTLTGLRLAQVSLAFGVDELTGPVSLGGEENRAQALTKKELVRMIQAAGYEPIEVDALYNEVSQD